MKVKKIVYSNLFLFVRFYFYIMTKKFKIISNYEEF